MLGLRKVFKKYNIGAAREITAIDGVDLFVERGTWISIVGSNGAGKTTLVRLISGELHCDSGSIHLDGREMTKWPFPRRSRFIGRGFQNPEIGTAGSLTIEENFIVARQSGRFGLGLGVGSNQRQLFHRYLATLGLGLEDRLSEHVSSLSGGERQSLALLMAVIKDPPPKLLLLDEHVSSLDPRVAETVMHITDRLIRDNALTTLMITHKIQDALNFSDRLVMLHRGSIVLDIQGTEKEKATVDEIVSRFRDSSRGEDEALPDASIL